MVVKRYAHIRKSWLVAFVLAWCAVASTVSAQVDVLYSQDFEGPVNPVPGLTNGLHGLQQFNNQTWSYQNVWSRSGFTGVNAGTATLFRTARVCGQGGADSTTVSYDANSTPGGSRGAHIITASCTGANFNHAGYHTIQAPNGVTADTRVGLYNSVPINTVGYNQVVLRFNVRCNGQVNLSDPQNPVFLDYGLVRYSVNSSAPGGLMPDGSPFFVPANDAYWTDLIPVNDLTPNVPGVHKEIQGVSNFIQAEYILPADAANNPNLRIAFFWVNNSDGVGAFPALTIDDIQVVGSAFSIDPLPYQNICQGSVVTIPFTIQPGLVNTGNVFTLQLSDQSGSFANPVNIGTLTGTTSGSIRGVIPVATSLGGGYRLRIVASNPNTIISSVSAPMAVVPGTSVSLTSVTPQNFCVGASSTLTATSGGDTYLWYRDGVLFSIQDTNVLTTNFVGAYHAEVRFGGCAYFTDTTNIDTLPRTPAISFNLDTTVCYQDPNPIFITGATPSGGQYFGQGLPNPNGNPAGSIFNTVAAGTGRHRITYIVTYPNGCPDTAYGFVNVVVPVAANLIVGGNNTFCQGDSVALTLTQNTNIIEWFRDTLNPVTVGNGPRYVVRQSGSYFAELTSPQGCTWRTDAATFTVQPIPTVGAVTISGIEINSGTPSVLRGRSANPVNSHVLVSLDGLVIGTANTSNDSSFAASLTASLEGGDTLRIRARIDTNCDNLIDANDSLGPVTLFVIEDKLVTAFSPNGDGVNDTWRTMNNAVAYTNAEITVFNRWGMEVFKKPAGDSTYWDGKDLADGTYFFVVDRRDGTPVEKGSVTLMR